MLSEIIATRVTVGWRVVDDPIGDKAHRQVCTRRAGLFASVVFDVTLALRLCVGSPLCPGLGCFRFVLRRV